MQTKTIENQLNGGEEIIENPLLTEHVNVGRLIWYHGFTSQGRWDCPAIIRMMSTFDMQFWIRSLDDMLPQDQPYAFDPDLDQSYSRQTMRLATA